MRAPSPVSLTRRVVVGSTTAIAVVGLAVGVSPPASADLDPMTRMQAVHYAQALLDAPYNFENDCTYYVSQALWLGGMEPTADWTPKTSDPSKLASHAPWNNPGPSKVAADADDFKKYMERSHTAIVKKITWSDNTAAGAELGDVIAYDWDGPADGHIDHLAIVTSFTDDHHPNVSQHSPTRQDRYWSWDPDGKNWIEFTHPGSRASLIHFN